VKKGGSGKHEGGMTEQHEPVEIIGDRILEL